MSLDCRNSCRLCGRSTHGNLIPIFEKVCRKSTNFAEKIKSYLHVVIPNSNEPGMCHTCHEKIVNWDKYAEQVQRVQEMFITFTNIIDNEKVSENDDYHKPNPISQVDLPAEHSMEPNRGKHKGLRKGVRKKRKEKLIGVKPDEPEFAAEDDAPLIHHLSSTTENLNKRLNKNEEKTSEGSRSQEERKEEGEDEDCGDSKDEDNSDVAGFQSLFTWACLECHTPVKNWNALVKHCREVHDCSASVQCVCGKFLQSRASIMKHRMKHTTGYGFKCQFEKCNKTFHRQQLLDIHSLSHMPKDRQPWMCCKCSRRFHTESLLKQHEKVHLPKEEKLVHPCEICQKKFCSKSAVSAHLRAVHLGERPFVCDQCGHSFTSKGILHEHLTIHSDVYNFHCKDCNKSFKTKYRLKIHMDTHMETRYQCPTCNLTLNTRRTLRMHLLVHREDKAFQCTTCGKAFKRSKDLKNHYNLHTGRRPYTCPFCQKTFANGSNCRSHKRRMHPEELKVYEAAIAAGQAPVISGFRPSEEDKPESQHSRTGSEFPEESNESDSRENDETSYHLVSVPFSPRRVSEVNSKMAVPDVAPLNLHHGGEEGGEDEEQDGGEGVLEEEKDGMVCGEERKIEKNRLIVTNFAQNQNGGVFPVNSFYTLSPAFPGNTFFRQ